jgi:heparin binding hemagglutinin HbhA
VSQPDNQPNPPQSDLANQLRELGQQIETAVRNAMQSDKAKQVQQDVAAGMKEIGTQLQSAVKSMQDNPKFQEFVERGEQAVNQAQQSKIAQDFQESLARGIAQLNDQLAAFITRTREDGAAPTTPPPSSDPATGETTRLDPDQK